MGAGALRSAIITDDETTRSVALAPDWHFRARGLRRSGNREPEPRPRTRPRPSARCDVADPRGGGDHCHDRAELFWGFPLSAAERRTSGLFGARQRGAARFLSGRAPGY